MANPNIGQLLASTWNRVVTDKPEDQIFKDVWLFDRLNTTNGGHVKLDGGAKIEVSLEYAVNSTFKSYSDMEALDVYKVDLFDAAEYEWKEHAGTIVTSLIEIFKNSGKAKKFDILESKINNALLSAKRSINTMLFGDGTGNSSKDWHGLQMLVPDTATSGTVGAINRATFTWWRTNSINDGGSSYNALRSNMGLMYNACSDGAFAKHPTFGVMDKAVFAAYEALLTANERFTSKDKGEGAFKNEVITFKGMKLAFDGEMDSSARAYFLNEEAIKIYSAKGIFLKLGEPVEPANQTIDVRKVVTIGNLVVKQSRRLGVIYSIA
jgi:hypothetical protein